MNPFAYIEHGSALVALHPLLAVGVAAVGGVARSRSPRDSRRCAPLLRRRIAAPRVKRRGGTMEAFLYGLAYTLATVTTGVGPLLLLLTVAAAIGRPLYGGALSLAYGIGRGLPFLLLGIFASTASGCLV